MEFENKVKMLQRVYLGSLVDSLRWYTKEGVLEKVTEEKRKEQFATGKQRLEQFSIIKPEQVFIKLSELFNCTNWEITKEKKVLSAISRGCLLCDVAKKLKTGSPCNIYCLDPMEGMIKAIDPEMQYKVRETLWDGDKCKVDVMSKNIDY